jgi:hypothetical protein
MILCSYDLERQQRVTSITAPSTHPIALQCTVSISYNQTLSMAALCFPATIEVSVFSHFPSRLSSLSLSSLALSLSLSVSVSVFLSFCLCLPSLSILSTAPLSAIPFFAHPSRSLRTLSSMPSQLEISSRCHTVRSLLPATSSFVATPVNLSFSAIQCICFEAALVSISGTCGALPLPSRCGLLWAAKSR